MVPVVPDLASFPSFAVGSSRWVTAEECHRRKKWMYCFCQSGNVRQIEVLTYVVDTSVTVATVLVTVVDPVYTVETVVVEMGTSLVSVLFPVSKTHP